MRLALPLLIAFVAAAPAHAADLAYLRGGSLFVTGGGQVATGGITQAGFSPDGRYVAYVRHGGLWLAHADGTRAHRIAAARGSVHSRIAWTPADTRITFVGGGKLRTVTLGGSRGRTVSAGGEAPRDPSWSRRGRLVYASRGDIRISNLSGRRGTRSLLDGVTAAPDRAASPSWAGDSHRVALIGDGALTTFAFQGFEVRRVSPGVPDPVEATWAPDADRIAFAVRGHGRRSGLYTVRPDGTGVKRLVAGGGVHTPVWVP